MRKVIIGSLSIMLMMMLLPVTSIAESNSALERIEKQHMILKELQENLIPKNYEPACILRLLLWIRNAIIILSALMLFMIIKNLFNITSLSTSNLI